MAPSSLAGDLRRLILNDSAVAALVGGGPKEGRVHLVVLPQPAKYPAVVLTLVSGRPVTGLGGYHHLRFRRVQVDCWAGDADTAMALGEAVFDAIEGASGAIGRTEAGHVLMLSERDLHEPEHDAFRRTMDFQIAEGTR